MYEINGYKTVEIRFVGDSSYVAKGIRLSDNKPVIMKITKFNNADTQALFKHEYDIGRQINSDYVCKYLELNQDSQCIAIIIEDDSSIDLAKIIPNNGFSELEFLNIAMQIAKGILDIHALRIIHKDIKPSNIIIHPDTRKIKLIDFGSATLICQKKESAISLHADIGTLLYLSPEQTGRTNHTTDYRTDFYSLGITFYQLLCGKLPFDSKNAMDLVHQQLAKMPTAPHLVKPSTSIAISNIIMKLLSKDPEQRYQSCQGIIHDLIICQTALQKEMAIDDFVVAQHDIPEQFTIPEKLYGRENEVQQLINAITRIALGRKEIIFVAGEAGIGKSALLDQVKKPLTLHNGFFIAGKFDQYNKGIAYSAISQAFQALIKQLLGLPENELLKWKTAIVDAVSSNGQQIINIIPDLVLLIGNQPAVQIDDPVQQKNIFIATFIKFVHLFAQSFHPLVLFLDDLQWADNASLELISVLAQHQEINHFLLIGAYRDNEVNQLHPLIYKMHEIKSAEIPIQTLKLLPLDSISVNHLLADTLRVSTEITTDIADIIFEKTLGNPFFVKSFIKALYDDRLITLSPNSGWQWDLKKIKSRLIENNVVDFTIQQIKHLPITSQEILKKASCLGSNFTHRDLSIILLSAQDQLSPNLMPILNSGIVIKCDDLYCFAHDRIQEAAYALIPDDKKSEIHLSIGRTLYSNRQNDNELLKIVGHFNKGKNQITDTKERFAAASLNLTVALKAKQATAYADALTYLEACLHYIHAQEIWNENYTFAFNLYKELIEIEYLNGHFDNSLALINVILPRLQSVLDNVEIYNILIIQQTMQGEYQTAFQTGDKVLRLLSSRLPFDDTEKFISHEFANIRQRLHGIATASLIDFKKAQHLESKATFKVLFNLFMVGYLAGSPLLPAVILMIMKLSLDEGNTPESCLGYAAYGILLCAMTTEYKEGNEFGKLAIQLADKFNSLVQKCRSYNIIVNCIYPWSNPLHNVNPLIDIGYEAGLKSGELQYAGYILQCKARTLFYQGMSLSNLQNELLPMIKFAQDTKNQVTIDLIRSVQLIVANLSNTSGNDFSFNYNDVNEGEYLENCKKTQSYCALCLHYIMKAQVYYLYGHFQQAFEYLILAEKLLQYIPGQYALSAFNLYYSLTLIALYPQGNEQLKHSYLIKINQNQQQMKIWLISCEENFLHKHLLVEAELAKILCNSKIAGDLYDQAIEATHNKFIQEQALACELAAKYWMSENKALRAEGYANASYRAYRQWGVVNKLDKLKQQFAILLNAFAAPNLSNLEISSTTTLSQNSLKVLDLASILMASHSISMEVELDKLLHKIMEIIIKNSGAQNGAFLLAEKDGLYIQAEYLNDETISTLQKVPLLQWSNGAHAVINYVNRTHQPVVISDATESAQFKADSRIVNSSVKSVLCMPVMKNNVLKAILYIENNLFSNAFTPEQVQTLIILTGQMAISLENLILIQEKFQATEQYQNRLKHFIATFSHEMRNPLTIVTLYATSIAEKIKTLTNKSDEKELSEGIQLILDAAQMMLHIADDVLQASKLDAGGMILKNVLFNPKEITIHCIKMQELPMREKNIVWTSDYTSSEDIIVMGDPDKFRQILTNLLNNAIKFTQRGGTIGVKFLAEKQSPGVTKFTISVQDNGPGIALNEQEEIFKRFKQGSLKESAGYGGAGLGLAIARDLVKLMNGDITVQSKQGSGAVFTFTIQCNNAPQQDIMMSERRVITFKPPHTFRKANILIVDDNAVIRQLLKKMLELADYHCEVAANGNEAINIMRNASFQIDIILMDILMPECDGIEATKTIRKDEKQKAVATPVPIIGLTANASESDKEKAFNAGMNAYLTKPFQKEVIYSTVDELLTKSTSLPQPKTEPLQNSFSMRQHSALIDSKDSKSGIIARDSPLLTRSKRALPTDDTQEDTPNNAPNIGKTG